MAEWRRPTFDVDEDEDDEAVQRRFFESGERAAAKVIKVAAAPQQQDKEEPKKKSLFAQRRQGQQQQQQQQQPPPRTEHVPAAAVIKGPIVERGTSSSASSPPPPPPPIVVGAATSEGFPQATQRKQGQTPFARQRSPPKPVVQQVEVDVDVRGQPVLGRDPYEAISADERRTIASENNAKLQSMTRVEIEEAQEQLRRQLSPQVLARLQQKAKPPTQPIQAQTTEKKTAQPIASNATTVDLVVREKVNELVPGHQFFFKPQDVETDKLAWTTTTAATAATTTTESVIALFKERFPQLAQVRYDFEGKVVPVDSDVAVSVGLHHHGDEPDQAGYTIGEMLHLCRSALPSQRALMLKLVGVVVAAAKQRGDHQVLAALEELNAVLYLRTAMDDTNQTVMVQAVHAMAKYVGSVDEEHLLHSNARRLVFLGHVPIYFGDVLSPLSDKDLRSLDDATVTQRDVVTALLVRMSIADRIHYLLDRVALAQPDVVEPCLLILLRIARHSKEAAVQLASHEKLLVALRKKLVEIPWPAADAAALPHSLAAHRYALWLATALAPVAAEKLFAGGFFDASLRFVSVDHTISPLVIDTLVLWHALASRGLGLDVVLDMRLQLRKWIVHADPWVATAILRLLEAYAESSATWKYEDAAQFLLVMDGLQKLVSGGGGGGGGQSNHTVAAFVHLMVLRKQGKGELPDRYSDIAVNIDWPTRPTTITTSPAGISGLNSLPGFYSADALALAQYQVDLSLALAAATAWARLTGTHSSLSSVIGHFYEDVQRLVWLTASPRLRQLDRQTFHYLSFSLSPQGHSAACAMLLAATPGDEPSLAPALEVLFAGHPALVNVYTLVLGLNSGKAHTLPLGVDWMFAPIADAIDAGMHDSFASSAERLRDEQRKTALVAACLEFVAKLQRVAPGALACVDVGVKLSYLTQVFLVGTLEPAYRDDRVQALVRPLWASFVAGLDRAAFPARLRSLVYHQLVLELWKQYTGTSFGDPLFAEIALFHLHTGFPHDTRVSFWVELADVLPGFQQTQPPTGTALSDYLDDDDAPPGPDLLAHYALHRDRLVGGCFLASIVEHAKPKLN